MMSISPSLFDRGFSIFDPFQSFFSDNSNLLGISTNTEMDWKETKDAHVFQVDLPGLTKNDVKLELHEGKVLQITGERSEVDAAEKDEKWHCKERTVGKFTRRIFRLPENAKMDEIKATMENGVLTVTVPKNEDEEVKETKHRAVEITGDDEHQHQRISKGLGRFVCCKA
ncbi:17.8 kDa class I heat shock protein-like [Telopea speciosissima]|uniref:17.8 kDa class I heat shock protein-like n=1 Tax=Telopea speciosissima TaxID=54955 RepID=UPI001CC6A34C|nr:17.8 kDa class I heat shock protein-like [Telopea speciosissima]